MIDVKGIRSEQSNTDATDPLELHKPEGGNAKFISGWFGSLIGLGFYIRSFLWTQPQAATAPEDTAPDRQGPDTDDSPAQRGKASLLTTKQKQSAEQGEDSPPATDVPEGGPSPFPAILGPFDGFLFDPHTVSIIGAVLPRSASNATLPPFNWLGRPNTDDLNTSPMGAFVPPIAAGSGEPPLITAPDAIDEGDPSDDTDNAADQTRNRAPRNTGPVYLKDVGSGVAVGFALSFFLSQTTDPDGSLLSVSMGASTSGTLDPKGDGWRYLADADFLGEVQIEYTISDGEFEVSQTAYLNVVENILTGTGGDDLIVGNRGRDLIDGQAGDDNLAGLGGRDKIFGGAGDDNISGGNGNDSLFGGDGDDLIVGGTGDDWISGGAGQDRLYGEDGNDEIYGDAGDDEVYGGEGDDTVFGGDGDDVVRGDAGDDVMSGDAGRDNLFGDAGNDVIYAGSGDDLASGGEGNDLIFGGDGDDNLKGDDGGDILMGDAGQDVLAGGGGDDILSGGEGKDTVAGGAGDDLVIADDDGVSDDYDGGEGHDQLDYSAATEAVSFDLTDGTAEGESIGTDSFENFERFVGTAEGDVFHAAAGQATLTGNGGPDLYSFVQGDTVDILRSIYQITDYDEDDEIWIGMGANHRQIRNAQKSIEDRIEDGLEDYADAIGADEPRLSYHHDWTDTYRRTVIEVDFDRDKVVDLELILEGEHLFDIDHV